MRREMAKAMKIEASTVAMVTMKVLIAAVRSLACCSSDASTAKVRMTSRTGTILSSSPWLISCQRGGITMTKHRITIVILGTLITASLVLTLSPLLQGGDLGLIVTSVIAVVLLYGLIWETR